MPYIDIRALWLSGLSAWVAEYHKLTRGSATAEEPRDALRQLKYYSRFLTELLTRSSANPEEPCEHTVSWNHVKCYTNVRLDCMWKRLQPMNDLQSHSRSLPLPPFDRSYTISYQSSIVSVCQSCTVFEILTLICQKLRRHVTLTMPTWGTVYHHHKTNSSRIKRA